MGQSSPAVQDYNQSASAGGSYGGSAGVVSGGALPPPGASSASSDYSRPSTHQTAGWSSSGGARVALRPGETVDTLARRYGVSADAIVKANGLSSASDVAAGQQLIIPTYRHSGQASLASRDASSRGGSEQHMAMLEPQTPTMRPRVEEHLQAPQASANAAAGGSYTVQSGDTLSRIASRTGVSIDALKAANNLSGSAIRVGQTLSLPSGAATTTQTAARPTPEVKPLAAPKVAEVKPQPTKEEEKPAKVASLDSQPKSYSPPASKDQSVGEAESQTKTASLAPKSSGIGKLRWPVQGQVVATFGSRSDGNRDDGIDISVPEGTPVKAAENGVVIYAGDGLKEYGNTVLIRHDDGLVTVYGYAKDLKVKRGDKVTRGEVVADSGMSGAATRPKLHFEVRKDATPVNPMSYLD